MFQGASIVHQTGAALLAAVTVIWAVTFVQMRRRGPELQGQDGASLRSLPVQSGPPGAESVELTADERDAFARLVRQFGKGRG
ncbi:hypothetical protein [Streptomyces sp. NPDC059063]|uniref:hypothetical protein n=1 Tax=unclassified Streptomyces TaxID=2593676 RepID=UPI0036BF4D90